MRALRGADLTVRAGDPRGTHAGRRRDLGVRVAIYASLIATSIVMIGPSTGPSRRRSSRPATSSPRRRSWIPNPFTLQNYRDVFTLLPFQRYFLNSVIVTAAIVGLNVVFDTAAAYAFAKLRFPGRNVLFFMLLLTLMVPFQVNLIPLYRIMVELHQMSARPRRRHLLRASSLPGMIQVFGIFLMRQFLDLDPRRDPRVGARRRRVGVPDPALDRSSRSPRRAMATLADLHVPRRLERLPVAAHRHQLRQHADAAGRPGAALAQNTISWRRRWPARSSLWSR